MGLVTFEWQISMKFNGIMVYLTLDIETHTKSVQSLVYRRYRKIFEALHHILLMSANKEVSQFINSLIT